MGGNWGLIQENIHIYFHDRKSRFELLGRLWIDKSINLEFFTKRISDERKILKSELNSMKNINRKDAGSAASAALDTYFREILKFNNG